MRSSMPSALLALLILCFGASLATAQAPVTRPAISEEISPVQEFSIEVPHGSTAVGVLRRPPGPGPFPAVVIPYPFPLSQWRNMALDNATMTRFLAAGYITVMHAPSRGAEDPQGVGLASTLATISHVKGMSEVDSNSVVLYGCSIAGLTVLQVAAETEVAALTVEDPGGMGYSSVVALATDPSRSSEEREAAWFRLLEDPREFFTPELRRSAQEEFRRISGPIFLLRGDGGQPAEEREGVDVVTEFLIPDLEAAGNEVEMITYAGQNHCFGFFATADRGVANDGNVAASQFFTDMNTFFKRHLLTQPRAVDESLIEHVSST